MAIKYWNGSEWLDLASGATGPQGPAGNGISSVVLNPDYTLTINFTNGSSTTTTSIRGAQGEQGIGITSIAKTSTSGLIDTYTITLSDGTTTTFTVTNGERKAVFTATILAADWTGSGPYINNVTISGLVSTDNPIMDLMPSSTYLTAQSEISAYGNIYKAECTTDGTLVVYAVSAPIIDLNIQLLCVR